MTKSTESHVLDRLPADEFPSRFLTGEAASRAHMPKQGKIGRAGAARSFLSLYGLNLGRDSPQRTQRARGSGWSYCPVTVLFGRAGRRCAPAAREGAEECGTGLTGFSGLSGPSCYPVETAASPLRPLPPISEALPVLAKDAGVAVFWCCHFAEEARRAL